MTNLPGGTGDLALIRGAETRVTLSIQGLLEDVALVDLGGIAHEAEDIVVLAGIMRVTSRPCFSSRSLISYKLLPFRVPFLVGMIT